MGDDRSWMYNKRKGSLFSPAWKTGLDSFLDHAFSLPETAVDGKSKCPCTNCDCRHKRKRDEIEMHLCRNGFQVGYERWINHGEPDVPHSADYALAKEVVASNLATSESEVGCYSKQHDTNGQDVNEEGDIGERNGGLEDDEYDNCGNEHHHYDHDEYYDNEEDEYYNRRRLDEDDNLW